MPASASPEKPPLAESSGDSGERLVRSTETIRQTAKWLVTLSAGLGSLLLAGIRFGDLGRTSIGGRPFWFALAGAVVALASVGSIIFFAGRVLLGRYTSILGILDTAEEVEANKRLSAELLVSLMRAIAEEKNLLFQGSTGSVRELFGELRFIDDQLLAGRGTLPPGREHHLRRRRSELQAIAERVIDFADHWVTRERFQTLMRVWVVAGASTALGIGIFALAVSSESPPVEIKDRPIPVRVFFTSTAQEWVKKNMGCSIRQLDGVAISGSVEAPEVVTPSVQGCSAFRFVVTSSIGVAVPQLK